MLCKGCQKDFAKTRETRKRSYCSNNCRTIFIKARQEKRMNSCAYCGNKCKYTYCSRACTNKGTPQRYENRKDRNTMVRVCPTCNLGFTKRRSTYCSGRCYDAKKLVNTLTLAEAMSRYKKHHKSSAYALVRSHARTLLKDLPKICRLCGYSKHVEVAHIRAISDFPDTTLISEVNQISNLVQLCPNCHWEYDSGLTKL